MSKTLFSLHLDDEIKGRSIDRAALENRSLANLLETALIRYLDPPKMGARVTIQTSGKGKNALTWTARVVDIINDKTTVVLDEADPITGLKEFPVSNILSIHLL